MSSDELKDTQTIMEEKVYRIWTVLSAFEGRHTNTHIHIQRERDRELQ